VRRIPVFDEGKEAINAEGNCTAITTNKAHQANGTNGG
jgi:hypothetical protein